MESYLNHRLGKLHSIKEFLGLGAAIDWREIFDIEQYYAAYGVISPQ